MLTARTQTILEQFDKIHLEEMDRVQLMNRVDTKFTFSSDLLVDLLPQLNQYYKVLEVEGFLLSEYESLYYDNKEHKNYLDHHKQLRDRFKVRFRRYVNSDIAFLEVKHKINGRTDKSRIRSNGIPQHLNPEQEQFIQEQGLKDEHLIPCLFNRFKRITLVNKTMNERLTLDIDLAFEWEGHTTNLEKVVIAELKQERSNRLSPFYALMKANLIRPSRVSKYCVGMIKTYGKDKIKYNRFKKKLLQIHKIQTDAA